jgi:hypothetical protein
MTEMTEATETNADEQPQKKKGLKGKVKNMWKKIKGKKTDSKEVSLTGEGTLDDDLESNSSGRMGVGAAIASGAVAATAAVGAGAYMMRRDNGDDTSTGSGSATSAKSMPMNFFGRSDEVSVDSRGANSLPHAFCGTENVADYFGCYDEESIESRQTFMQSVSSKMSLRRSGNDTGSIASANW